MNSPAVLDITDHFLSGTNEAGEVGDLGWNVATGTASALDHEAGRPGIRRLTNTTSSGAVASINLSGMDPDAWFDVTFWVRIPTDLSLREVRVGYTSLVGSAPPTNGVYVEFDSAGSANWSCVARASGAQSLADSGVLVQENVWYKLRIYRRSATAIRCQVDDTPEIELTEHIPTEGGELLVQVQNLEAVAKTLDIDKVWIKMIRLEE